LLQDEVKDGFLVPTLLAKKRILMGGKDPFLVITIRNWFSLTSRSTPVMHPPKLILVLHGPEIFDSGEVYRLLQRLRPARVIVAGVMARTAAEESGISCEFISVPPSMVIRRLKGTVVLANHGKTPESGQIFGQIVASRLYPEPLCQLEASNRTLYVWNRDVDDMVREVAGLTRYTLVPARTEKQAGGPVRTIRGCQAGEAVYVNGVVIGTATGPEVVVRSGSGGLEPVSGLEPKAHGLEKLRKTGFHDLSGVWCKSGRIRNACPGIAVRKKRTGKVLFIDHCGHDLYRKIIPETCGIVSIGDDTTAVCGHIASHLGIPVFGIIDGDGDNIIPGSFVEGSVIARALRERDDDIGAEIAGKIPERTVEWDVFSRELADYLSGRVALTCSETGHRPNHSEEHP
jgi:hypothetical protein